MGPRGKDEATEGGAVPAMDSEEGALSREVQKVSGAESNGFSKSVNIKGDTR